MAAGRDLVRVDRLDERHRVSATRAVPVGGLLFAWRTEVHPWLVVLPDERCGDRRGSLKAAPGRARAASPRRCGVDEMTARPPMARVAAALEGREGLDGAVRTVAEPVSALLADRPGPVCAVVVVM